MISLCFKLPAVTGNLILAQGVFLSDSPVNLYWTTGLAGGFQQTKRADQQVRSEVKTVCQGRFLQLENGPLADTSPQASMKHSEQSDQLIYIWPEI